MLRLSGRARAICWAYRSATVNCSRPLLQFELARRRVELQGGDEGERLLHGVFLAVELVEYVQTLVIDIIF